MNDAKALWLAIRKHPREDTPKLVLADWYAEQGDLLMENALRWCVARGKWPFVLKYAVWTRQTTKPGRDYLPRSVFLALPRRRDGIPIEHFHSMSWRTAEGAIRALGQALARLRAACEVPA